MPGCRVAEESLQQASLRRREAADKEEAAQSQALVVADPMSAGPSAMDADRRPGQAEPDDMGALLPCLAACFTVHPALWLGSSQSQAYRAVSDLLGRVMLSRVTQSVPEVGGAAAAAAAATVALQPWQQLRPPRPLAALRGGTAPGRPATLPSSPTPLLPSPATLPSSPTMRLDSNDAQLDGNVAGLDSNGVGLDGNVAGLDRISGVGGMGLGLGLIST
jgi:hypothetical protein